MESPSDLATCLLHADKPLALFCVTCRVSICTDCVTITQDHRRHVIDNLKDVHTDWQVETERRLRQLFKTIRKANESRNRAVALVGQSKQDLLVRVDELAVKARAEIEDSAQRRMGLL